MKSGAKGTTARGWRAAGRPERAAGDRAAWRRSALGPTRASP